MKKLNLKTMKDSIFKGKRRRKRIGTFNSGEWKPWHIQKDCKRFKRDQKGKRKGKE